MHGLHATYYGFVQPSPPLALLLITQQMVVRSLSILSRAPEVKPWNVCACAKVALCTLCTQNDRHVSDRRW